MSKIWLKIIFVPVVLMYMDSLILFFFRDLLTWPQGVLPLFILNLFIGTDILIRERPQGSDRYKFLILVLAFVIFPVFVSLPYMERHLAMTEGGFGIPESPIMFLTGLVAETAGGVILVVSRLTLGKFGTTGISIEPEHQLVTKGIYRHIRHPIYLGMLLLIPSYCLALSGFISAILCTIFLSVIINGRIKMEEEMLEEAFGDEYLIYKKKTRKLIPGLY